MSQGSRSLAETLPRLRCPGLRYPRLASHRKLRLGAWEKRGFPAPRMAVPLCLDPEPPDIIVESPVLGSSTGPSTERTQLSI